MCTGILVKILSDQAIHSYSKQLLDTDNALLGLAYATSTQMENLILWFMHGQYDNEIQPTLHYYKFCRVVETCAEMHR